MSGLLILITLKKPKEFGIQKLETGQVKGKIDLFPSFLAKRLQPVVAAISSKLCSFDTEKL